MAGGSSLHDKRSTSATGPDDFAGRRGKGTLLWRTKCPALVVVSMVVALLAAVGQPAQAGGPKYVAGVSYFNSSTLGTPLTWAQGSINYYTDQGDLSPILPGAKADALVADAFSQWTSISTAAVAAIHGGQLGEDVSGANVYLNPDGRITMPSDILPSATGTPIGVVYDLDGSVTSALLGQGAGDPSQCFSNAAFGGIDNFGASANFLHALVVINGNCAQAYSQLTDVEYRLVRVLGRVLGLDWSQANGNVLTHKPPPTSADYTGFPVMHPTDPPNCIPITLCYPNPYTPKMDDQASISRLYPVTAQNISNFTGKQIFSATTARIFGNVYFINAGGQAAQGMQGVNVVARWIDPNTGLPTRNYVATSISGFLFCGNAGNPATGFNDPTGLPYNRFGSNDTTIEGFFDLAGLQIPNGGTSAQYQLSVEAIDPFWSTTIGPYGPWQTQPSGSIQPMTMTVTLGGNIQQDMIMQGSALPRRDPFQLTTYASPARVPIGGDWLASLSPYGDIDYFWFSGQANRTLSVLVTALDESGAASYSKAEPVIGMWTLSDNGTFPAPANTPSPFNTSYVGLTTLNAQLSQITSYRIGVSDVRGDGRPDYHYHARILYGNNVTPARASVAGGTPLAITGLGFRPNTTIAIANIQAPALVISANQLMVAAPAQADGLQNISLTDPPTLASSILSNALTYGAGPDDNLVLIPVTNPSTPAGGQTPNPIQVRAVAPNGVTPVTGASVVFSSTPAVAFSACGGATICTVLTDQSGLASTFITVLTAGTITITVQLAPASYSSPKQVQTTLLGTSSALDIALAPQISHIVQGATLNTTLTARVLSQGAALSGITVNYQLMKGSATLKPASVTTDSNGYASTTLGLSALAGDVQVSACVAPNNSPCQTFYGTAVPGSGLQLQPVAGSSQAIVAGQNLQPVIIRATDTSTPPNPVLGASIAFQSVIERSEGNVSVTSGGDTTITRDPTPVILASLLSSSASDVNGFAIFQPSTGGFQGGLEILGVATAGASAVPFEFQLFPPMAKDQGKEPSPNGPRLSLEERKEEVHERSIERSRW